MNSIQSKEEWQKICVWEKTSLGAINGTAVLFCKEGKIFEKQDTCLSYYLPTFFPKIDVPKKKPIYKMDITLEFSEFINNNKLFQKVKEEVFKIWQVIMASKNCEEKYLDCLPLDVITCIFKAIIIQDFSITIPHASSLLRGRVLFERDFFPEKKSNAKLHFQVPPI